jgi:hypothetical protein
MIPGRKSIGDELWVVASFVHNGLNIHACQGYWHESSRHQEDQNRRFAAYLLIRAI